MPFTAPALVGTDTLFGPETSFTLVRIHRLHIALGRKARLAEQNALANKGSVNDEERIYSAGASTRSQLRGLFGRYGISAACGYKWLRAYQEKGFAGLEPKSRRPHAHPDQTRAPMEREILSLRDQHPA